MSPETFDEWLRDLLLRYVLDLWSYPQALHRDHEREISTEAFRMSEQLYTVVSTGTASEIFDNIEGDTTTWVKAEIFLGGESVATGFAPERPPYVEGTARSSAISMAQIQFNLKVLCRDIREVEGTTFKNVKGAS